MPTLTVTSKGQITLRKELLRHLNVQPGQQVTVDKLANGVLALHVKSAQDLQGFVGCLPSPAKPLSIDEMNAVAAEGWAARK